MEKAFAAQFSQDKVGISGLCARFHGDGCPDRWCCCSGVLHLHGGGGSEGEPVGAKVRHSVLLLSRLLSHLHPAVAWNQSLLQQDHQVRVKPTWTRVRVQTLMMHLSGPWTNGLVEDQRRVGSKTSPGDQQNLKVRIHQRPEPESERSIILHLDLAELKPFFC